MKIVTRSETQLLMFGAIAGLEGVPRRCVLRALRLIRVRGLVTGRASTRRSSHVLRTVTSVANTFKR